MCPESVHTSPPRVAPPTWVDGETLAALELVAESATELAGFGVAAISVARDDGFEVVAVAGDESARRHLLGTRSPSQKLLGQLERADDWGAFQFLPHDRQTVDLTVDGWVPDIEPDDDPESWHPLDVLGAPLRDPDGAMIGYLGVDVPDDGRRPGPARRRIINKYAEQAERLVVTALAHAELNERVRMATAARTVVRTAAQQLTLDGLLGACAPALIKGFRAEGMWLHLPTEGAARSIVQARDGSAITVPPSLIRYVEETAPLAWAAQRVDIITADGAAAAGVARQTVEEMRDVHRRLGISSILMVPLGAGPECLGSIGLARAARSAEWSDVECEVALDVAHDLGRAVLNARTFERERRLVDTLRELDTYKSELIATVSHELQNPLAAVRAHLELVTGQSHDPDTQYSLDAMERGTERVQQVLDGLLLLSRYGDQAVPLELCPVDLAEVVREAGAMLEVTARARGVLLLTELPLEPVVVLGGREHLDRVVSNLLSNAVKYTPAGGRVLLTITRPGPGHPDQVALTCTDDGIGISEADQERLFGEFFRSADPAARAEPGTGLGLAIVARIVERLRGRIEVESEVGAGSTFRVLLPTP